MKKIHKHMIKPCKILLFCPYGIAVEEYPLKDRRNKKVFCKIFGHDCPVFYLAEDVSEGKITKKEMQQTLNLMFKKNRNR